MPVFEYVLMLLAAAFALIAALGPTDDVAVVAVAISRDRAVPTIINGMATEYPGQNPRLSGRGMN